GGMREPPQAPCRQDIPAPRTGSVVAIDNRRLARIAKLAGAPKTAAAGIDLQVGVGDFVERGQPMFTLHSGSPGTLAYAAEYALAQIDAIQVAQDD
ncbi:MAG: thymidine phosphorylase, partial [Comamonadaceae bacterium]